MVPELLPGGGPLNGRRWAGQQLLQLWLALAGNRDLPLLTVDPSIGGQVSALIQEWGGGSLVQVDNLVSTHLVEACGGLLVPDPSIGLWSFWRDAFARPAAFSLIGQIHTLCTVGAMTRLEELTPENVFSWDALICSSSAGRSVVDSVLSQREERQAARAGVPIDRFRQHRPQLPVIPLPMPVQEIQSRLPSRAESRQALGLPAEADVLLWLGRLTIFSKADPAPLYRVLNRVASQRERPLFLIELGPDDGQNQGEALQLLRAQCPAVCFLRLGADQPVSEQVKDQALAAADIGVSLVDNLQETFGQSVVELLAAGLPVVASDWDGYRDLVGHGHHGFLVPSRWSALAETASVPLGWKHRIGALPYALAAGALAQLVQLDLDAAEGAILTLLRDPALRRAMGRESANWARQRFDRSVVASQYDDLFGELERRRFGAPERWRQDQPAPLCIDPVRCFNSFTSDAAAPPRGDGEKCAEVLGGALSSSRADLWAVIEDVVPMDQRPALRQALEIKHGLRPYLR